MLCFLYDENRIIKNAEGPMLDTLCIDNDK